MRRMPSRLTWNEVYRMLGNYLITVGITHIAYVMHERQLSPLSDVDDIIFKEEISTP